jgi:hypothetical protein
MISGNLSRQELAEKEAKFKVGGCGYGPSATAHCVYQHTAPQMDVSHGFMLTGTTCAGTCDCWMS